jgi:hypothetical protein
MIVVKLGLHKKRHKKCQEYDIVSYKLRQLKFVTLKRHTPDKFDQFLEDKFLTGRAISMTLCMKITVTIVLVLKYQ